ncbi:ribosome silencing factor [Marinilactibacillus psychrotolerans]|uniref:Ribosomal silencing factor RsfS n=1 Tax=Marinilactibacillus psychrotolerans TaxID=191770 RepID=A0AAV3WSI4_9LACT|nr:ribosome silencing factor [Marinilactibacillus psychrotolerans]GEL66063.1 ribosomal silencing factor RsfS [Marinilactibacillus psychrotolerans]GEQ34572.1 ribosome silencing factor RsfS [Marinilactibacillus psychrotolerans]SDB99359.1 ribosome-associated protein [Marinilactibacillus psychrotolerans]
MTKTAEQILELVVKAADDKQAEEIIALDMKGVSLLADYFVVTHGNNERQIDAITNAIKDSVEKNDVEIRKIEGKEGGKWILIDLGEVIVHLFNEEEREFYQLERLWTDADYVDVSEWIEQ